MNIFLESTKIHTNSNKTKTATGLLKSNKNHLKKYQNDIKLTFLQFSIVGNHVTLFSMYFILEKNNLNKTQITPN